MATIVMAKWTKDVHEIASDETWWNSAKNAGFDTNCAVWRRAAMPYKEKRTIIGHRFQDNRDSASPRSALGPQCIKTVELFIDKISL